MVKHPTEKDRQTCLCKLHESQNLMVTKLASLQVIEKADLHTTTQSVCCDTSSSACTDSVMDVRMLGWHATRLISILTPPGVNGTRAERNKTNKRRRTDGYSDKEFGNQRDHK